MDLSDLLDLIFTGEEDLRKLGAAAGPEGQAAVDQAVAASRKAREEVERLLTRIIDKAGLARQADVDSLAAKVERLAEAVEALGRGGSPR